MLFVAEDVRFARLVSVRMHLDGWAECVYKRGVGCLGERLSRRARFSRWVTAQWRSLAWLLVAAPVLLALGMLSQEPRSGNILISAGSVALFIGLLGASGKFSFLGFRWQPLLVKRDALTACTSPDFVKSYVQFAKLVVGSDQAKELIEHAVRQTIIHCDELPSRMDKYNFGLCTMVRWLWKVPTLDPKPAAARSRTAVLGASAAKALFRLDTRSRVLYVLTVGGYAAVDEVATWLDETPDDIRASLARAQNAFDSVVSA